MRKSILNSLKIGTEHQLETIAFPAIGTGIAGFPLGKCAEIFCDCFLEYLPQEKQAYKRVQMVLFSKNDYLIFKDIFRSCLNGFQ